MLIAQLSQGPKQIMIFHTSRHRHRRHPELTCDNDYHLRFKTKTFVVNLIIAIIFLAGGGIFNRIELYL